MNKKDKEIENLKTADEIAEYASKSRDAYDGAWDITRLAAWENASNASNAYEWKYCG